MEQVYKQLLSFIAASALECVDESNPYGSLRLLETLQQMITLVDTCRLCPALSALAVRIEEEKGTALTDRVRFRRLTEDVALTLVDCV